MAENQTLTILEYELPVKIVEDPKDGYTAFCPDWSDCYAQGDSLEEVLNEIYLAAASLIELYKEEDLEIPSKVIKSSRKPAHKINFNFPIVVPAY